MNATDNTVLLKSKYAQKELRRLRSPKRAQFVARYFKTGPGEYGFGDRFLGVSVPQTREVAKKWKNLSIPELKKLVSSPWHEDRSLGFMILGLQFDEASKLEKKDRQKSSGTKAKLFKFLWTHRRFANNWDLIDGIMPQVMGCYFFENPRIMKRFWPRLYRSSSMWEQRMSILATHYFIRQRQHSPTVFVSKLFLNSKHDLIHKATGWMLRESGKRDPSVLIKFLRAHAHRMPRTMLRYSIERLPRELRMTFLRRRA